MIYFDSAATTFQKPASVGRAVTAALARMTSPGRGEYGPAARASQTLLACRECAGDLFQVEEPERVVLTFNATHGLNIAVRSLVKPGSQVLLSGYEHNAVTRPLYSIPGVQVRVMRSPLFRPDLFLEELERRLAAETDVMICTHVSNVFGYILPVDEIAALCRRWEVPLLVDASQSAGVMPVRMRDWGAAFAAMPGHKGLYGPQGSGLLLCQSSGDPVLLGGTGSASRQQEMPDFLPDRLEAGTHNVPGAAGLLAGMQFVKEKGPARLLRHEQQLLAQAAEGLNRLPGVQVYWDPRGVSQSGVVSFRVRHRDPGQMGELLGQRGIAVRTGLHCAPMAHETAGTERTGTVRVSFSAFNTGREVERFLRVMRQLV